MVHCGKYCGEYLYSVVWFKILSENKKMTIHCHTFTISIGIFVATPASYVPKLSNLVVGIVLATASYVPVTHIVTVSFGTDIATAISIPYSVGSVELVGTVIAYSNCCTIYFIGIVIAYSISSCKLRAI